MDPVESDWYGPDMATFGDRLGAAREQAAMSQSDMAKRLGIKVSTLRNWEQDLSEPRANRLSMMAGLLNVSIMWLLNAEGEGISGPDDGSDIAPDIQETLNEIRDMKTVMKTSAERLARLEKKLRLILQSADHG
jgi:transcriptional regulator with XRE-family HTH domain